jgi:hypothetical protein
LKSKIEKKNELKIRRKKQANLSESLKPELISKIHNLWNSRPELDQEAQFPTNLMLNDEIIRK